MPIDGTIGKRCPIIIPFYNWAPTKDNIIQTLVPTHVVVVSIRQAQWSGIHLCVYKLYRSKHFDEARLSYCIIKVIYGFVKLLVVKFFFLLIDKYVDFI